MVSVFGGMGSPDRLRSGGWPLVSVDRVVSPRLVGVPERLLVGQIGFVRFEGSVSTPVISGYLPRVGFGSLLEWAPLTLSVAPVVV